MRNKKLISVLVTMMFMFSMVGMAYGADDLTGHWSENQVRDVISKGIMTGYPDGTYKPDGKITRAEFVVLISKAKGWAPGGGKVFNDTSGHWAREYISTACAYGIVKGYDENTFGPDNPVTREQVAVMVSNALGLTGSAIPSFADNGSIADWSREFVGRAVGAGVMSGYPDGTFRPANIATRAESAIVVSNVMKKSSGPPSITIPAPNPTPKPNPNTSKSESGYDYSVIDKAGTYGPSGQHEKVKGNVEIRAKDVVLRKVVIEGNLTLAKGIGEGDVDLENVVVEGKTYVYGGGEKSIYIKDGKHKEIVVDKDYVRLDISDGATIDRITVKSGLRDVTFDLAKDVVVKTMYLDSKVEVNGRGEVREARGSYAWFSDFEIRPDRIVSESSSGSSSGSSSSRYTRNVSSAGAFRDAMEDSEVRDIKLTGNLSGNLSLTRSGGGDLAIDLGGYTISGDVTIYADSLRNLDLLSSSGTSVNGDLTVRAGRASVVNKWRVSGEVNIVDVDSNSWIEEAVGNRLVLRDNNGSSLVLRGTGTRLSVESTVRRACITANTPVSVYVSLGAIIERFVNNGAGTEIENRGDLQRLEVSQQTTVLNLGNTMSVTGNGTVVRDEGSTGEINSSSTPVISDVSNRLSLSAPLKIGGNESATVVGVSIGEGWRMDLTSSKPEVVKVEEGVLKAESAGSAVVSVKIFNGSVLKHIGSLTVSVSPADILPEIQVVLEQISVSGDRDELTIKLKTVGGEAVPGLGGLDFKLIEAAGTDEEVRIENFNVLPGDEFEYIVKLENAMKYNVDYSLTFQREGYETKTVVYNVQEPEPPAETKFIEGISVYLRDGLNSDRVIMGDFSQTGRKYLLEIMGGSNMEETSGNPGGNPTVGKWFGVQIVVDGEDDITKLEYKTTFTGEFAPLTAQDVDEAGRSGEIVWWINGSADGVQKIWLRYAGEPESSATELEINYLAYGLRILDVSPRAGEVSGEVDIVVKAMGDDLTKLELDVFREGEVGTGGLNEQWFQLNLKANPTDPIGDLTTEAILNDLGISVTYEGETWRISVNTEADSEGIVSTEELFPNGEYKFKFVVRDSEGGRSSEWDDFTKDCITYDIQN